MNLLKTILALGLSFLSLAGVSHAQLRMTEVNLSTKSVEVTNFGSASISLTGWFFCHRFSYPALSGTIAPGASLQFSVNFNTTSSDIGLYQGSAFGSTTNMHDFVQWGAGGIGRESVAVAKGIWTAGTFFPIPTSGLSYHAKALSVSGIRFSNWFVAKPHAGFPLPKPVVTQVSLQNSQWVVRVDSYLLPAAHAAEVRPDLSSAWQPTTATTADLGNRILEMRFSSTGARQFAQIKSTF